MVTFVFIIEYLNKKNFDLDTEIGLTVGGKIFETTVDVLIRDPYSILAACCRRNPIILPDPNTGIIYINRDWWLFRHILAFLRSNVLPNELEALIESVLKHHSID
mmetsp:Transcript_10862/g.9777  ORF Transcript_10862/g.9777 Transcript_10862/m.9777 type:complete len:105 (-) Transcript_10862:1239-1553(-)